MPATVKKNYFFRGLDTRTNKLFRQEGTSSDCRNVRLDSTRKLVKRNEMDKTIIPRGTLGEVGLFEDKLPYAAVILDIFPYEDHFIIATKIREEDVPTFYRDVNKFYRWDKDTNIVTFIPFEKETFDSANIGQIVSKQDSDMLGQFTSQNMENVLYFVGNEYPQNTLLDGFPLQPENLKYNRSSIFTYDGKVIGRSGCPAGFEDQQTEDIGTQAVNEYMRLLPIKIDTLGRHTFGNFSTHFGTNIPATGLYRVISSLPKPIDDSYDHIAFLKLTNPGTLQLDPLDTPALRTVDVTLFERSGVYKSAAKGQILYGIDSSSLISGGLQNTFTFHRCTIEDIDYVGGTATLGEFKRYSGITGLWEDSPQFIHTDTSGTVGASNPRYLSNIITAVYGSNDFAFGYKLKTFVNVPFGIDATHTVQYTTTKSYTGDPPNPVNEGAYFDLNMFLWMSEDLNDIYDETTVKLPPPKVRHLTNFVGSIIAVDEASLYFSDFSLGGNIETFTPFDTFKFGSTERGEVTGVFANETYIVGFREQEAYYITGNIFTANYRIQSYKSTRIGCSDPRSIVEYRGACMFASEKGMFLADQGGSMQEMSDTIENLFTNNYLALNLDQFDVKTLVDFKREYIYFSIGTSNSTQDSYILAYSYYHNEWFIYEDIETIGGFNMFNGSLYASDGTDIYIESSSQIDVDAYYRSNFETLGVPSFAKKFLQVLLFTMDTTSPATIGIKTYRDWNEAESDTDETIDIAVAQVDATRRLNPNRSKSLAIEIKSLSGQQLVVNGYEYEFSDDIKAIKSDD